MGKYGWKTIVGTFLLSTAGAFQALQIVPEQVIAAMTFFGGLLGGIGIRAAIAKLKD